MKKIMYLLVALIGLLPFVVKAAPVKVYIFEAGGCPACEAQVEYLQKLESYGKKFEIVKKELYVDHVEWAHGKDYELGVKVANAFRKAGIGSASVNATPLVVISDLYAKNAYSDELDKIIDEAYEKGDKDVIGCIEAGNKNCLRSNVNIKSILIAAGIIIPIFGLIIFVGLRTDSKPKDIKENKKSKKNKGNTKASK